MRPRLTWLIVAAVVVVGVFAGVDALRSLGGQPPPAEANATGAAMAPATQPGGTAVERLEYPLARAARKLEATPGVQVAEEGPVHRRGRSGRRYVLVVDPPEFDGLLGIPANSLHLGDLYHRNRVEVVLLRAGNETFLRWSLAS
jgi:hypothetical protein